MHNTHILNDLNGKGIICILNFMLDSGFLSEYFLNLKAFRSCAVYLY